MINFDAYSDVVQLIYDAGLDFSRWPAALDVLADRLGASAACLVRHDFVTSSGAMIMVRADPKFAELYTDRYVHKNVIAKRAGIRPPQTCVTDRMFMTKEELFRTEFYGEFLQPIDVHSILNVFLVSSENHATRLAFGRASRAGEWEQEQIDCVLLFAPHLHRAALINQQLEFARLGAEGAVAGINRLAQGVIVVDAVSRPIFVNQAAEHTLAEADGLVIGTHGLAAANRLETAALRRMIAEASNGDVGASCRYTLTVTRPSRCGHYSLLVTPLHVTSGWFLPQRSGAIVFVSDPERPASTPPSHLRQLYGLTPAEAALTMRIVHGGGLRAAIKELDITLSTARTHLQHTFQKTGTHRQADLVRLVLGLSTELVSNSLTQHH